MSKIEINEIQSLTSNGDLTITPNGTGVLEVTGDDIDGTLQLNDLTQSNNIKIKAPPNSAGQSYTMILPSDNITADKFLQVNSITGSGATAVGQLGFETVTADDPSNLNADNLSSGNLPAARFPSSFAATNAGLQLVSKQEVGSTNVATITFTGFDEGMYLLIGKNIKYSANEDLLVLRPKDSSGNDYGSTDLTYETFYGHGDSAISVGNDSEYVVRTGVGNHKKLGFIAEISNLASYGSILVRGMAPMKIDNKMEVYGSFKTANKRIYSLELESTDSANILFTQYTQFLLYKYGES